MKFTRFPLYVLLSILVAACSDYEPPRVVGPLARPCYIRTDPYCGLEQFEKLSIQDKLKAASAVILTKNKTEGNEVKGYVDQVLKLKPGTTLYLTPGTLFETYPASSHTNYGDGALVILRGSPASRVHSYAFEDGVIDGLGNMPLTELKRILDTP